MKQEMLSSSVDLIALVEVDVKAIDRLSFIVGEDRERIFYLHSFYHNVMTNISAL